MSFHLQLYPPKALDWTIQLLALFLPAALTAYLMHSLAWLVGVPFGIVVLMLFIAALPSKRHVTAEQFADELEKHLLGTEGPWIGMTPPSQDSRPSFGGRAYESG